MTRYEVETLKQQAQLAKVYARNVPMDPDKVLALISSADQYQQEMESTDADHSEHVSELEDQIRELQLENDELQREIAELREENEELLTADRQAF